MCAETAFLWGDEVQAVAVPIETAWPRKFG